MHKFFFIKICAFRRNKLDGPTRARALAPRMAGGGLGAVLPAPPEGLTLQHLQALQRQSVEAR